MEFGQTIYKVAFKNSGETSEVSLATLGDGLTDFLEHYAEESLVGKEFYSIVASGSGEARFMRLLEAAGCAGDPQRFFTILIEQLQQANGNGSKPIAVNGVTLPHMLLVALLEKIMPQDKFYTVRDVKKLESLTNIAVAEEDRAPLQKVLETYPVRLSAHTIRQMRVSRAVSYQYLPFVEELDPVGHVNTWIGQFHQGLLEQMYQNRVIFLTNMTCPVYCRFCFRKHKESRNQSNPTAADVAKAVEHVRNSPSIKEIVVTGGDPFLNRGNLAAAIDGLKDIPHVQTLRLATRSIAYYPQLFYAGRSSLLNYLKQKHLELQQRGKRVEVATHFIHPDEVSPQSLDIISELVRNGIAVYVQTPFLRDCNDAGPELTRLYGLLRGAGAELHYIYIPCSPIHGNSVYWTPLSKGVQVANYLRAHLSDRVIPRICTATPIGKMDWHSSGWAVEKDKENENFVWIRTPYTPEYFKAFAPVANDLDIVRVNAEGTLDARYMAKIGDERLFFGARPARPAADRDSHLAALRQLQAGALQDQRLRRSIVSTPSDVLGRLHETRVELDAQTGSAEIEYIGHDSRITDVVIASRKDALENLYHIAAIIEKLRGIHHVNAVRLKSLKFNYAPQKYTPAVIDRLANLNKLSVVNPLRLEIETQFLHPCEFRPEHAHLANALRNKGITVYSNTPLLGGINDTAESIQQLAYECRAGGIEFHHLYIAGLPLQLEWNVHHPIDLYDVIDIATRVRREGSGREIPRYMVWTELGEVDYGLTSQVIGVNGKVALKLLPYSLEYFRAMQPTFAWPDGVETADDGNPVVNLSGVVKSTDFALC
ncbi:radical SAM protein [Desulfoferrobacter suflitae]|uniref:radical SAM protein n=1 Tax=Desulfoferrobacter suflitae TaxID=2865782 RepID=UPI002164CD5A|nr:radical SAM protein [Desulfoferrobacter suflitae]MCK8601281.1 radical SAM protein [Desulfoferrobacter suflitae]